MEGALLTHGSFTARIAGDSTDVERAQALRYRAFISSDGAGREADRFDLVSRHLLVEDRGRLRGTFRFQLYETGAEAAFGYSGSVYDLAPLAGLSGSMVEMGRFCTEPGPADPDVLRIAWAAITRIVDRAGAALLFGCSSFRGTDPAAFADALGRLGEAHLGPPSLRPGRRAPETFDLPTGPADPYEARRQTPPLLRTYLSMGGWVSDHGVIDRVMNTVHVFTGVEIAKVPPRRAQALRALASN